MFGILNFLQHALLSYCHACKRSRLRTGVLCSSCANYLADSGNFKLTQHQIGNGALTVYSIGYYRDDLARIIISNKQNPSNTVLRYLANHLLRTLPLYTTRMPLIHVPGSNREPEHLVDGLAIELHKRGWKTSPMTIIQRRFLVLGRKSQKELTQSQRHKSDFSEKYVLYDSNAGELRNTEVVLLDDICTSGATLLSFKKALEALGVQVRCAVTLAYTPKYS